MRRSCERLLKAGHGRWVVVRLEVCHQILDKLGIDLFRLVDEAFQLLVLIRLLVCRLLQLIHLISKAFGKSLRL